MRQSFYSSVIFVDEPVTEWVLHGFLERVYTEPAVGLAFQLMVLTCLVCDLRKALMRKPTPRLVVTERGPFGNYHVFAKANLSEEDLKMFEFVFPRLMATLPEGLEVTYVHLVARTSTLSKRIQERGRDAESSVTIPYLDKLDRLHFEWLRGEDRVYELDANAEASVVCDHARPAGWTSYVSGFANHALNPASRMVCQSLWQSRAAQRSCP